MYLMRYTYVVTTLPKLDALFFRTSTGSEPVREWLLSLPKNERRAIGTDIAYVQYKWPIGKPHVDHLRGEVWEVRSRLRTRIARVLFAVDGKEMVLLHGFVKSSQKTSGDDIALAESRWRNWKRGRSE
jgi:phage-related protein